MNSENQVLCRQVICSQGYPANLASHLLDRERERLISMCVSDGKLRGDAATRFQQFLSWRQSEAEAAKANVEPEAIDGE